MPDMKISILWYDDACEDKGGWVVEVYYPGSVKNTEEIAESINYDDCIKAAIKFLEKFKTVDNGA